MAALFVDFQSIKNEGLDHIAHKECQKASQFYFQFETTERQHKDKGYPTLNNKKYFNERIPFLHHVYFLVNGINNHFGVILETISNL